MDKIEVKLRRGFVFILTGLLTAAAAGQLVAQESTTDCEGCPFGYDSSVQEIAGQRYRKIALSGFPLADEKPQAEEETDQAREESFIDALNHTLSHSVTDIYVPLGGTDLTLDVRRNSTPEIWNDATGLTPEYPGLERPDRPFGYGWTSNLAANIEFITQPPTVVVIPPGSEGPQCPIQRPPPDLAIVTDENGATHRFAVMYYAGQSFLPMPDGKHETDAYVNSLLDLGNGTFEFRKKFGTTLTFEMAGISKELPHNRLDVLVIPPGSPVVIPEGPTHSWARLISVKDRAAAGSGGDPVITCTYNGSGTLIPDQISARGRTIQITKSQDRITQITDPNGKIYQYAYATQSGISTPVLQKVTSPVGGETTYSYEVATEIDPTPRPPVIIDDFGTTVIPPDNFYHYFDLTGITDPNNNSYAFAYDFDHSRLNCKLAGGGSGGFTYVLDGYYPAPGNPRNVTSVTTPVGTAQFENKSQVKIRWGAVTDGSGEIDGVPPDADITRLMEVTDVLGNLRSYSFLDPRIFISNLIEEFLSPSDNFRRIPWNITYERMVIDHPGGSETFTFDADAGMQLTSATDLSGNTTTYEYADVLDASARFPFLPPEFSLGRYGDPTKQTNALGKSKTFAYDPASRIMTEIVDELGRKTVYDIDPTTLVRTREKVYVSSGGALVRDTEFKYENSTFPGFLTRKIDYKLSTDPSWMTDNVTQYVPEAVTGNVYQEIVDPSGLNLITEYTYDANNNRKTVKDPRAKVTTFTYDDANRLTDTKFHDNTTKVLTYDLRGNKKTETDENGHVIRFDYDAANRLKKVTREMEAGTTDDIVTEYAYNALGSKTGETDPRGGVTSFEYDNLQRLTKVTDSLSNETLYEYDPAKNCGGTAFDTSSFKPTKITDPRGYVTDITYDKLYREVSKSVTYKTGTAPALIATEYDDVGNLTKVTDPLNKETVTEYDALNQPTKVTFADAKFRRNYFTSTGLKWKERDEFDIADRETETEYDAAKRPVKATGALVDNGSGAMVRPVTETGYDGAGNVVATINPRGYQWDYEYDDRNRKVKEEAPTVTGGRPTTVFGYDNVGNLASLTDPRGNTTDYEYDAANRMTKEEGPSLPVIGRPTTTTEYDKSGNIVGVTDPNNHVTTNTYDALNRLKTTTDAENITVTNEYDEVGNRKAVIDGKNQRTEFEYDGLNRNTKIKDAANYSTTFEYNGVNKTARVDAESQRAEYEYDNRHRLTQVNYIGRSQDDRTYAYDDAGNLLSVTEPGKGGIADVAYTYDNLNRQATETSSGHTHTYKYDLANNRIYTLYGGTSITLISTYDTLNRLSTLTEGGRVTTYAYDLNGNVLTKTLPNGDIATSAFDALNRRATLAAVNSSSASLYSFTYTYDAKGNLKQSTEAYNNTSLNRTVAMTYDDIDRLTQEVATGGGAGTTAFAYDNAHNRSSMTVNGVATSYSYNNLNQLTSRSDGTTTVGYTYDANGNRATEVRSNETLYLSYDYENRLIDHQSDKFGIFSPDKFAYVYDYRTRRVRGHQYSGLIPAALPYLPANIRFVFSGGTSVAEFGEDEGTSDLEVVHVRGSDWGGGVGGILYSIRPIYGQPFSFSHSNGRGDIVTKTSASGAVSYQQHYRAFGEKGESVGNNLQRQGANSKDEERMGLINDGFRMRDPKTGTFITRDPLGFVDGPNLYAYVVQNPWTKFDPEGLQAMSPEVAEFLTDQGMGDYVEQRHQAQQQFNRDVETLRDTTDAVASLNPVQNAITAVTGKSASGKQVSGFEQGTAIVGMAAGPTTKVAGKLIGEAKAAVTALKGGEKAAEALNDANKAAATGVKVENSAKAVSQETETVQRVMSNAELQATKDTGLVRGGREGVHHVTDAANSNANRARQRLALDTTPEVKATLEVPKGEFSKPTRVQPANNMPGGGMERKAQGNIPAKVVNEEKLD